MAGSCRVPGLRGGRAPRHAAGLLSMVLRGCAARAGANGRLRGQKNPSRSCRSQAVLVSKEMSVLQGAAKGAPLLLMELPGFLSVVCLWAGCWSSCVKTCAVKLDCCMLNHLLNVILVFRKESPRPLYISDRQDSLLGNMPLVWIFQVQVFLFKCYQDKTCSFSIYGLLLSLRQQKFFLSWGDGDFIFPFIEMQIFSF